VSGAGGAEASGPGRAVAARPRARAPAARPPGAWCRRGAPGGAGAAERASGSLEAGCHSAAAAAARAAAAAAGESEDCSEGGQWGRYSRPEAGPPKTGTHPCRSGASSWPHELGDSGILHPKIESPKQQTEPQTVLAGRRTGSATREGSEHWGPRTEQADGGGPRQQCDTGAIPGEVAEHRRAALGADELDCRCGVRRDKTSLWVGAGQSCTGKITMV
jgi:hypothetical protein